MVLKTQRLEIRYIESDDWKNLIEIWKDFNQSEYSKYDIPHSLDEAEVREKTKRWAEVSPCKEHMFFAVCHQEEMIGYIDFHKDNDGYECGYCFHGKFHGMGYAKESMRALLEWLSRDGSKQFAAGTALNNLPSVRLLDSLGFRKIREEKVSFYKDGNGEDIYFNGGVFVMECTGGKCKWHCHYSECT
ncbi:N-acetyltransferase [bacterium D16-51]|nr:N-acetyltransferase [bacterium D16-59]RKI59085.1 N-acetyltransferase [bacterium D16-51]